MTTYQWAENIRKRPGMFIGNLGYTGICNLLKDLFEEILECRQDGITFEFSFRENNVSIHITHVDACRFSERFQSMEESGKHVNLSLGVLFSLSSEFKGEYIASSSIVIFWGGRGEYESVASTAQKRGERITLNFTLDKDIFPVTEINYEHITGFLRKLAYLNPGVKIISEEYKSEYLRNVFLFERGVAHQLEYLLSQKAYARPVGRLDVQNTINNYTYQISCCYEELERTDFYIESYANNQETYWGGSLVDGILDGLITAFQKSAADRGEAIEIDRANVIKGLVLLAIVRGDNFNYTGSVRYKLDMPQIEQDAKALVFEQMYEFFQENEAEAGQLLARFTPNDI